MQIKYTDEELTQLSINITERINNYIKIITPNGMRMCGDKIHVYLCCNGVSRDGHLCSLKPGHSGKCCDMLNGTTFTPYTDDQS